MRETNAIAAAMATETATPCNWFCATDWAKRSGKALMKNCTRNDSSNRNAPTMKSDFCESISSEIAKPLPHIFVAMSSARSGFKCRIPIEKNSALNKPRHEAMMSRAVARFMVPKVK